MTIVTLMITAKFATDLNQYFLGLNSGNGSL